MRWHACSALQACEAVRLACQELAARLKPYAEKLAPGSTWQQLVGSTLGPILGMPGQVPLTAHAHGSLKPEPVYLSVFGSIKCAAGPCCNAAVALALGCR